jgi:hypothetical protein
MNNPGFNHRFILDEKQVSPFGRGNCCRAGASPAEFNTSASEALALQFGCGKSCLE